jgi:SAM-dependent methyltransferase
MDHYKETAETWNKVANLYEEKFMELDYYNESYDFLINSLSTDQTDVLELACGPGMITRFLLSKRPDLNILATDVAPRMLELAAKNNPTAKFQELDSRKILSLRQKFDSLVIGFCIPYMPNEDVQKLLLDGFQLLKPNGILYLSFIDGDDSLSGPRKGSSGDSMYFYYHPAKRIQLQLENTGFNISKIFEIPYPLADNETETHTIFIAKKQSVK